MQQFLDALERIVPPTNPEVGIDFAALVDRVHRTYLRHSLGVGTDNEQLTLEDIASLRRLALYLEAETTVDAPQDGQLFNDSVYVAATIFEFLGQYEGQGIDEHSRRSLPVRLAVGDLADYTRSLVLYSLGRYESNSVVIGRRLLRAFADSIPQNPSLADELVSLGLHAIVALVSRDLRSAIEHGADLGTVLVRVRQEGGGSAFPVDERAFLAVWLEVTEAAATVAAGLLNGSVEVFSKGRERLAKASRRAISLRQSFAFWVADKLGLVVDLMYSHSVFRVLDNKGLRPNYLELLATTGVTELWSSQAAVVEAGLLDSDEPFVVNLPTGAGKSLIAEMAIAKALLGEAHAWGLYIVPSRALVHQVEADLRQRLPRLGIFVRTVIAGAEPASTLDEEIADITMPRTVTILTPEKLDIYFRNQPELFASCRLLIVDEAHKIADPHRGALVDTLLTRFRLLVPEARLLLLSAVLSNVLQIATWLNNPDGGIRHSWRPTRQLKGLAVKHGVNVFERIEVVRRARRVIRVVQYQGGVVLVQEASDLDPAGEVDVDLPGLFLGEERSWLNNRGQSKREGPTVTDHAADLAARFHRLHGVTVVFLPRQDMAERCARLVAQAIPADAQISPTLVALVEHLALLLGQQHGLLKLVRRGVAFHHAGLPTAVRRVIETALRDGVVKVLCTTATLQEGVNTPATTVIIAGAQRWDTTERRHVDLSQADFTNIAGRAGRAGRDTEGQVIFLPIRLNEYPTAVQDGDRYFFPREEAFAVVSALQAVELELERVPVDEQDAELSAAAQVALLALQAAGLDTEEDLHRFFSSSLATFQLGRPPVAMASTAHRYLASAVERHGEDRIKRFAKTGLSMTDCEKLDTALRELVNRGYDVSAELRVDGSIDAGRLTPLIDAVFSVPQFRPGSLGAITPDTAADVLARWMNGASYPELAALTPFGGNIQKVVRFLSAAGNDLSWGLGSAYLILDLIIPDGVHQEFGLLPLYIEFGVNNAPAAYLSLLGVSERGAANALASKYKEAYGDDRVVVWHPFTEVEEWMRQLTEEDLRDLFPSRAFRYRILLDDLGLSSTRAMEGRTATLLALVRLNPELAHSTVVGELCDFTTATGGRVEARGRITRRLWGDIVNTNALREFAGDSLKSLFGVALGSTSADNRLKIQVWRRRSRSSL